jgi:hypothetical protein
MVSSTTASCPEAAATLAAMKGTVARSGSSRPWLQWNSILVKVTSSVLAVATVRPSRAVIYARVTSHSQRPDLERQIALWPIGGSGRRAGRRGRRQADGKRDKLRRLLADHDPDRAWRPTGLVRC